jgi:SAM-dependent methyltransferase
MSEPAYVFHRAEDQPELARLKMIEAECDPGSRRRLSAIGLGAGWSCLEVGPGAGSLLRWMADAVGPSGLVCGVDVSTRFLPGPHPGHVQILEGDICSVPLQHGCFDLVHARYLLIHVPDVERALSAMLASLKPGGWLVLEEPDFSASRPAAGDPAGMAAVTRVNQAIRVMYERLGMDHALGFTLPARVQRRGLTDLSVEQDVPLCPGGSGMARMMRLSTLQLREKYLATGVVSAADLDAYCRFAEDPHSWAVYYATVAVCARTPAAPL